MQSTNPCIRCGACCSHFRVSFYWAEADSSQGGCVPEEYTEIVDSFRICMKGTGGPHPRCIALNGQTGKSVHCTIYDKRPSPCRIFGVNYENGFATFRPGEYSRCSRARALFGKQPLSCEFARSSRLHGHTLLHSHTLHRLNKKTPIKM